MDEDFQADDADQLVDAYDEDWEAGNIAYDSANEEWVNEDEDGEQVQEQPRYFIVCFLLLNILATRLCIFFRKGKNEVWQFFENSRVIRNYTFTSRWGSLVVCNKSVIQTPVTGSLILKQIEKFYDKYKFTRIQVRAGLAVLNEMKDPRVRYVSPSNNTTLVTSPFFHHIRKKRKRVDLLKLRDYYLDFDEIAFLSDVHSRIGSSSSDTSSMLINLHFYMLIV